MNNFDKKLIRTDKGRQVLAALRATVKNGGGLVATRILHDDWCAFLNSKGECDCDPDIEIHAPQARA
jgi:hypothetical protein